MQLRRSRTVLCAYDPASANVDAVLCMALHIDSFKPYGRTRSQGWEM